MSLAGLERRFKRDPQLKEEYHSCIKEYIDRGFLSLVNVTEDSQTKGHNYYLPHHAVQKDSTSTRTRIVFDASRKSTSGLSLNDILLTGPAIQNDITSILMRWRLHRYAFAADIAKMYLQIQVHDEDRDYQRILWRFEPNEQIRTYRFNTVTFGVTSAPFLAIRTLLQLSEEGEKQWPNAAKIIKQDFYVDDVLSGGNTKDETKIKMDELTQLLKSGGFHLRKWISNEAMLLNDIPMEDKETVDVFDLRLDQGFKSLGVLWHPTSVCLSYRYNLPANVNTFTKRSVLSDIARLYDPLGWIAPITILAKCWMHKIWIRGLDWDEKLPDEMMEYWCKLRHSLSAVEQIKIQRWITIEDVKEIELHGFCDASQEAYGAVAYAVSRGCNEVKVQLLMAKTKVAPIKPVTIGTLWCRIAS